MLDEKWQNGRWIGEDPSLSCPAAKQNKSAPPAERKLYSCRVEKDLSNLHYKSKFQLYHAMYLAPRITSTQVMLCLLRENGSENDLGSAYPFPLDFGDPSYALYLSRQPLSLANPLPT